MPSPDQDELVVDLPSDGDDVTVEIDPLTVDSAEVILDSKDTEHEVYSKKVQRRIDSLTKKAREAERQQEAAINYARNIQAENTQLKGRVQDLDEGYVSEYGDRVATQTESLEKDLESAIATNDTAAQVETQKKLAQLAIEEERVKAAKQQQVQWQQQIAAQQQAAQQQAAQQPPRQQVPTRADPKAEDWASRNKWFGDDDAMTFAAFGIHKNLVEDEGFDTESPTYYDELDKRIREAFPHRFSGGTTVSVSEGRRPQQSVASATRSSNTGRKTVRLSPSEVAIANKLGVPLDEYAKHKR
tara:strand:- start:110 stop:1009 length:900 start_codon:yes stop_codon:yes gene_type:complete